MQDVEERDPVATITPASLLDEDLLGRVGAMVTGVEPFTPELLTELSDRYRDIVGRWRGEGIEIGLTAIWRERLRQVREEGFDPEDDDGYVGGQLASAAWCYLSAAIDHIPEQPAEWPWDSKWWKPDFGSRDLVRAGALIASELTRRRRAHDAFLALVIEACVAGGAERDYAAAEVADVVPDFLKEEGIEVGHLNRDWGVSGATALADELVLRHLEANGGAK